METAFRDIQRDVPWPLNMIIEDQAEAITISSVARLVILLSILI